MYLFVMMFAPACTLLSVGRFIKNEYAPALGQSDTRRLAALSTEKLADLYGRLTDEQLRRLMQLGTTPSSGPSTSKTAPAGQLDAFSSKGNRARLRVKSGGQKITFLVRRVRGQWRVEDLWIHQKHGHWRFQDVLELYVLALQLIDGLHMGKLDAALVEPSLYEALLGLVERLPQWGVLRKPHESTKEEEETTNKLRMVDLTFSPNAAQVAFAWGQLQASIFLSHQDTWKLSGAQLHVFDREPLSLETLAKVLGPTLIVLGDMRFAPQPEVFSYERVAGLLATPLRQQLDSVFAPLWRTIVPFVPSLVQSSTTTANANAKASANTSFIENWGAWLQKVNWKLSREGGLEIVLHINTKNSARILWDTNGKVTSFQVMLDGQEITTAHLAGFAPFAHWWEAVVSGEWNNPVRWVHEGVLLLDKKYAHIEKQLPRTFSLFHNPFLPSSSSLSKVMHPGNPAALHLPPMKMHSLQLTSTQLHVIMNAWDRNFDWTWSFSEGLWRLSSVKLEEKWELLDFLYILPPLWRLVEGLAVADGQMVVSALGPQAQARLGAPLQELLRVQGVFVMQFFKDAVFTGLSAVLNTTTDGAQVFSKMHLDKNVQQIQLDTKNRVLLLPQMQVQFGLRDDGVWGVELPTPKPVRERHTVAEHLLAMPELWPTLIGLYLGLAQQSPARLAAFSSPDFNAKVWRKLGRTGLQNLLKKFEISIEPLQAKMLFTQPQPQLRHARPSDNNAKVQITGTQLRMQGRWPFAKIFLDANGKKIELKFSWNSRRQMLVLDDVRIMVTILGRTMQLSLKNDLNALL